MINTKAYFISQKPQFPCFYSNNPAGYLYLKEQRLWDQNRDWLLVSIFFL